MDPENVMLIDKVSGLFPFIITIVAITIGGWVITTWLRIKNGYPLDGAWGQALHPHCAIPIQSSPDRKLGTYCERCSRGEVTSAPRIGDRVCGHQF